MICFRFGDTTQTDDLWFLLLLGLYCDPDTDWLEARFPWAKAWFIFWWNARSEGLDTPALLERALIMFLKKEIEAKFPKELVLAYVDWAKEKHKPLPIVE